MTLLKMSDKETRKIVHRLSRRAREIILDPKYKMDLGPLSPSENIIYDRLAILVHRKTYQNNVRTINHLINLGLAKKFKTRKGAEYIRTINGFRARIQFLEKEANEKEKKSQTGKTLKEKLKLPKSTFKKSPPESKLTYKQLFTILNILENLSIRTIRTIPNTDPSEVMVITTILERKLREEGFI